MTSTGIKINKNYRNKLRFHDCMKWVLVFAIVFLTDTLLFKTNINRSYATYATYLITCISVLMFLFIVIPKKRYNKFIIFSFVGLLYFVFIMLVRTGGTYNYTAFIFQGSLLIFGISFSYICSLNEFAEIYVRIMRFIAVFSLIIYVFGSVIVSLSILPQLTNTVNITFDTAFFSNVPHFSQVRNWGPYREPGVYQAFLNIALIFSLFVVKKKQFTNSIIFVITALTTLSGAALVPILLILFAYMIQQDYGEKKDKPNFKLGLVTILLAIIIVSSYFGLIEDILLKLSNEAGTQSFGLRYSSLMTSLKSFLRNPIIGSSIEVQRQIAIGVSAEYVGKIYQGTVNTFPAFFANYGFHIGLIYLVGTWKCLNEFARKGVALILVLAVILTTSNENLMTSLIISVLPFLRSEKYYSEVADDLKLTYQKS